MSGPASASGRGVGVEVGIGVDDATAIGGGLLDAERPTVPAATRPTPTAPTTAAMATTNTAAHRFGVIELPTGRIPSSACRGRTLRLGWAAQRSAQDTGGVDSEHLAKTRLSRSRRTGRRLGDTRRAAPKAASRSVEREDPPMADSQPTDEPTTPKKATPKPKASRARSTAAGTSPASARRSAAKPATKPASAVTKPASKATSAAAKPARAARSSPRLGVCSTARQHGRIRPRWTIGRVPRSSAKPPGTRSRQSVTITQGGIGVVNAANRSTCTRAGSGGAGDRRRRHPGRDRGARGDRVSVELGGIGAALAESSRVSQGAAGSIVAREARVEQGVVRTLVAERGPRRADRRGVLFLVARNVDGNVKRSWTGAAPSPSVLPRRRDVGIFRRGSRGATRPPAMACVAGCARSVTHVGVCSLPARRRLERPAAPGRRRVGAISEFRLGTEERNNVIDPSAKCRRERGPREPT